MFSFFGGLKGREKERERGRRDACLSPGEGDFFSLFFNLYSLSLSLFLFVTYSDRMGTVSSPLVKPKKRFIFVFFIGLTGQLFSAQSR